METNIMETKIKDAIQRRLWELDRGSTTASVQEELVSKATDMIVNSSRVDLIIDDITKGVVGQYDNSICTLEVTLEIQEDRLRKSWNEDFPNADLEDIVMEELLWSLPDTISVKDVTLPEDPLRQVLKNEVMQALAWSIGMELSDIQISDMVDKLVNHDDMWAYIEGIIHQLIKEAQ